MGAGLHIKRVVTRSLSEEVVIRRDIGREIDDIALLVLDDHFGVEGHAFLTFHHLVFGRDLFFDEDGFEGALGDAGAAIDTGIGIDEIPGPFILRLAGDDAFHRANFDTGAIPAGKGS